MKADSQNITRLLNTAKGQVQGVINMIEKDKYCIEISNQILAAIAVLKKANQEIIKAHLNCCVKEAFEAGINTEEKIEEVIKIIGKMTK